MKKTAWTIAALLLLARPLAAQTLGGCQVLPVNNAWNTARYSSHGRCSFA